jgi:hypothetical protein
MTLYHSMAGRAVALARPLPAALIAARAQVFDPLTCLDLNITARRVLFGILTFVRARTPTKEIFPRRDTLRAEALLQSDSTLYRGLSMLQDKGYITRSQTRRRHCGTFYLSPIVLTLKALVLLGLQSVIHKAPSTNMEDGHIKKERTKKSQSIQKTTGSPDSPKKDEIDRETRLPVELLPLLALGVKRSAVCWLMAKAKIVKQRLGDVVKVVKANIAGLRGREVVAYLAAMIRKNVDFAWVAKQAGETQVSAELDQAAQERLDRLDSRYDGYHVHSEDGKLLGVFQASSSPGQLALVHSPSGSVPVNLRFARACVEGAVRLVAPPTTTWGEEEFDD